MNVLSLMIVMWVVVVAYANGANANFKGVASLYGSGTCGYGAAVGTQGETGNREVSWGASGRGATAWRPWADGHCGVG